MAVDRKPKPVVIGLTGGIGSGKSAVLRTLEALGAQGIDADLVGHAVMTPGAAAYEPVLAAFGTEILAGDGQIDRRRLGQRVFSDASALARLESILHPMVGEAIGRWLGAAMAPMVAIEAIKLLEAGMARTLCDQVWVTACSPQTQLARLAQSRGMSADEVVRRQAMQMDQATMIAQADRVIDTNGTLAAMRAQVLTAWAELSLPLRPLEVRAATPGDADSVATVLNAVLRAGGSAVADHTFAAGDERATLSSLPARAPLTIAFAGDAAAGFQTLDRYARQAGLMDHVATIGTYVLPALREYGVGEALASATLVFARAAGYAKIVAGVLANDPDAESYYRRLGFLPGGRLRRQARAGGHDIDLLLYELFLDEAESAIGGMG
jgi:dephospho-CoA kinase